MMLIKMRWLGLLILRCIVCTAILLFSCGNNPLAGPSIVGNPSVSATILDEEGMPLKKVPVVLLPVNHNIVKDSNLNKFANGVTDDYGRIRLVNIQFRSDSAFNLTTTDIRYRYRLIKRIRSADTVTSDKSIALSTIKLENPGAIKVRVDSLSFKTGYVLTIPGTTIVETVTSPGVYFLSAPAGAYTINYTSSSALATTDRIVTSVMVTEMDTATITVNNFITTKTVSSVLMKDLTPDTLTIRTDADTLGPNRLDTLDIYPDTNIQKYIILKTDTVTKKDTMLLGRSTRTISDTFNFTQDSISTPDTILKNDSIFIVYTTLFYNKFIKSDTVHTIDTIMERQYGYYIVQKRLSGSFLFRKILMELSCPVLQPSLYMQYTLTDTILSINTSRTFDTTIQGDTIYFRDSTRSLQKTVTLDTIIKGDTTLWKTTFIQTDSIVQDSSQISIDTLDFSDSLRNVITNVRSDSKTILDTLLLRRDTVWYTFDYPDTISLPVTYYDFHSDGSNPEFEQPHPMGLRTGMVESKLDVSGKPVAGSNIMMNSYMKYWFRSWTDSIKNRDFTSPIYDTIKGALMNTVSQSHDTSFKNIVIYDSLLFTKIAGTTNYRFESPNFFPIDNRGLGNETNFHNYSFTMQITMNLFIGTDSKDMNISGDSEIWVFINNILAIDLGGIHEVSTGSCPLSKYMINGEKKVYPASLFLAERHSSQKGSFSIDIPGLRPH